MKKVVALSLFGEGDQYSRYLSTFTRAHYNLFPEAGDWQLRVYAGGEVVGISRQLLKNLSAEGLAEVHWVHEPPQYTRAMLRRVESVFYDDVSHVFCRDLDALPLPRDRRVCDEFIASRATISVPLDNKLHWGVMGGMCGFHAPAFRRVTGLSSLQALYDFAGLVDWSRKGADQDVLNRLLHRYGGHSELTVLEHRFNGWHGGPGKQEKRGAGQYPCASWSKPIEDVGYAPGLSPELTARADLLANHMGAAGYDHEAASAFWDEHGDPGIKKRVRACEGV